MVFYFTGTGNCLYIAKQLEAQPVSIPQVIHQENLHFCDKSIGIVAPVYGHEVPVMVKEFLHKATFDTDYFYMILTYGNRHGGAAGAGRADGKSGQLRHHLPGLPQLERGPADAALHPAGAD